MLETSVVTVMATPTLTLMDHSNDQFYDTCSWRSGAMLGARRYMEQCFTKLWPESLRNEAKSSVLFIIVLIMKICPPAQAVAVRQCDGSHFSPIVLISSFWVVFCGGFLSCFLFVCLFSRAG